MSEVIRVAVVGAAGRMCSQFLIPLLKKQDDMIYVGGIEPSGPPSAFTSELITSDYKLLFGNADVVIDFSTPQGSLHALLSAAAMKKDYICCTTGLTIDEKEKMQAIVAEGKIACVYAPNMSIGINLLFQKVYEMAQILGSEYQVEIIEEHHKLKKDAPSGTALRFGEIIADARGLYFKDVACFHREGQIGARPDDQIGIQTIRAGKIPGTHTIMFASEEETIRVTHEAGTPMVFAKGALKAARWVFLQAKGEMYNMAQVLGLESVLHIPNL